MDPRQGGPVQLTAGGHDSKGDPEPQQGGGDPRVSGAADQPAGEGVPGSGEPGPQLIGKLTRGGVGDEGGGVAEPGSHRTQLGGGGRDRDGRFCRRNLGGRLHR